MKNIGRGPISHPGQRLAGSLAICLKWLRRAVLSKPCAGMGWWFNASLAQCQQQRVKTKLWVGLAAAKEGSTLQHSSTRRPLLRGVAGKEIKKVLANAIVALEVAGHVSSKSLAQQSAPRSLSHIKAAAAGVFHREGRRCGNTSGKSKHLQSGCALNLGLAALLACSQKQGLHQTGLTCPTQEGRQQKRKTGPLPLSSCPARPWGTARLALLQGQRGPSHPVATFPPDCPPVCRSDWLPGP